MEDQPSVVVKDLFKTFKLPHEKHSGVKQAVVSLFRGKRGYETQKVLDDVSFEIKKGEFFGIVGRNGSGKSTLLKLLAGIYVPDEGLIQVNGSLTPFIELGVGFNPELTGRENVFMNGALLGFSKAEMEGMYQDIVGFAELEKFMDQKLKNYSSGMQVRLAFSIAIRAKSDILLLDEVLAVGDTAFQQKCYEYFDELKRLKKTVILVSHDMGAIRRFCTKAIYIKDGKLIKNGTASDIADIYVADNQESISESKDKKNQHDAIEREITVKIKDQKEDFIQFEMAYSSSGNDKMYIGMSLFKDGVPFAEMTTEMHKPFTGKGQVGLSMSTKQLNGGVYHMGAALFRHGSRELLALCKKENKFLISGIDPTRAGALKLEDTWNFEKTA